MAPAPSAVLAVVCLVVAVQIQVCVVEEPYLVRTHGQRYLRYAASTGRFLPGIGPIRAVPVPPSSSPAADERQHGDRRPPDHRLPVRENALYHVSGEIKRWYERRTSTPVRTARPPAGRGRGHPLVRRLGSEPGGSGRLPSSPFDVDRLHRNDGRTGGKQG